jgi:hypothetical protein
MLRIDQPFVGHSVASGRQDYRSAPIVKVGHARVFVDAEVLSLDSLGHECSHPVDLADMVGLGAAAAS